MKQQIIERFQIAGRGTVVVVPEITDLPVGCELQATVTLTDGSHFLSSAFKEWVLRRNPQSVENEAYVLRDVSKDSVPEGASIEVRVLQQGASAIASASTTPQRNAANPDVRGLSASKE